MKKLALKIIGEREFDKFIFESNTDSIVFFGATRCKVCREQIPILEQVAYEYREKVKTYWIDVDKYEDLFYRFRLQGIPNILIFTKGEVVEKIRGLNSRETLIKIIDKILYDSV